MTNNRPRLQHHEMLVFSTQTEDCADDVFEGHAMQADVEHPLHTSQEEIGTSIC